MNRVIIKDACLPLNIKEFIEEFSDRVILLVMNLFSGYD